MDDNPYCSPVETIEPAQRPRRSPAKALGRIAILYGSAFAGAMLGSQVDSITAGFCGFFGLACGALYLLYTDAR